MIRRTDVDGGADIGRKLFDDQAIISNIYRSQCKATVAEDASNRKISRIFQSNVLDRKLPKESCQMIGDLLGACTNDDLLRIAGNAA